MLSSRLPPSPCPECKKVMDGATCFNEDAVPGPGDVTVCMYCSALLVYEKDMQLRKMTPEEERKLPDEARTTVFQVRLFLAAKMQPKLEKER